MDADELKHEAAIFGPDWIDRLADGLHVNRTTVWRWANGYPIPRGQGANVRRVCNEARFRARCRTGPVSCLAGKRVLIVEDELIIALDTADALRDFGAVVVDFVSSVADARPYAETGNLDAAVLDVRLGPLPTDLVTPIALVLAKRRIPFVFATGYGQLIRTMLPPELHDRPTLTKPVQPVDLAAALAGLLAEPVAA